jgi:hypothetical protein
MLYTYSTLYFRNYLYKCVDIVCTVACIISIKDTVQYVYVYVYFHMISLF